MQTHIDKIVAPDGEFPVHAAGPRLAIILIGAIELYVQGPEDADRLIKAGAEAKRLMEARALAEAITDSERTCPEVNNGEHCHRGGDHGVHRDANGDEWRTDGGPKVHVFTPMDSHGGVLCNCGRYREDGIHGDEPAQDRHADAGCYDITGRTA